MSPTQRSLKVLRDHGATVAVVERWNPYAKIRQDLFGFADLLALAPGKGIYAIQVCSDNGGDVAERVRKILGCEHARTFVECGGFIAVHGWGKRGAKGKKKAKLRVVRITREDFGNVLEGAGQNPDSVGRRIQEA